MPDIQLNVPQNSRFRSSLNEVNLIMQQIFLREMRIADPRTRSREQSDVATKESEYLWDNSRVFQVDDLDTEEIFNTYLLRKKINNINNTDVSYPILGFTEGDIDTVFWGTGNRIKQNYFEIPIDAEKTYQVGEYVYIKERSQYFAKSGVIKEIKNENGLLYYTIERNGELIQDRDINLGNKFVPHWFKETDITPEVEKAPLIYKAKAITQTYNAAILVDNRDEAQYIRNNFILNCADGEIWFTFPSQVTEGTYNHVYTVFDIPNIDRYPTSNDKLKGKGYIYALAFKVNCWSCLTDAPMTDRSRIEMIRMIMDVKNTPRPNRIVITPE